MRSIRRLLGLVTVAMVIETAAYSAITPLLPGFASDLGLSKTEAGTLTAAYPVGTLLLALPAAWLSARFGPKPTVIGALALLGSASLAFGLAESTAPLIVARFAQGVGAAAVWAGGLAWVVTVAPRHRRAEAMGTAIGAAIAGALGGPVIGALADRAGTEVVFAGFAAVPAALIFALWRLDAPGSVPSVGLAALRASLSEPVMRRATWLMCLPALAFGAFNVLIPLRLDVLGAGAVTIAAVFLGSVVMESVVSPVAGRLADRRGAVWPARIGLFGGGVTLAMLAVPGSAVLLALAFAVAATLLGLLWTPAMTLMTDGAELRGIDPSFGFGLGNLAWGVGAAVGASGGGGLASLTADGVVYALLATAAVLTALTLARRRPVNPPAEPALR